MCACVTCQRLIVLMLNTVAQPGIIASAKQHNSFLFIEQVHHPERQPRNGRDQSPYTQGDNYPEHNRYDCEPHRIPLREHFFCSLDVTSAQPLIPARFGPCQAELTHVNSIAQVPPSGGFPSALPLFAPVSGIPGTGAFFAPNPSSHVMVRRRSPEVVGWGRPS